jgi:carbamoyl-phosphate synthase large subunit
VVELEAVFVREGARIKMEVSLLTRPAGRSSKYDDGYICKTAIQYKVPYITSMAAAEGIEAIKKRKILLKSLQEYHKEVVQLPDARSRLVA